MDYDNFICGSIFGIEDGVVILMRRKSLSTMVAVESPVKVVPCEDMVYSRSTAPVKVKVKPRLSGEFFCSLKYRLKARHPSGEWTSLAWVVSELH